MAHGHTTYYSWNKPEVGADIDAWGTLLNASLDDIDSDLHDVQVALDASEAVANAALPKAGGTMTGRIDLHSTRSAIVADGNITGTKTFDLASGDVRTATVTGNVAVTLTPVAGTPMSALLVKLTNGGAHTVSYVSTVHWEGGVAPSLTASGTDLLVFLTFDEGATWLGFAVLDIKATS